MPMVVPPNKSLFKNVICLEESLTICSSPFHSFCFASKDKTQSFCFASKDRTQSLVEKNETGFKVIPERLVFFWVRFEAFLKALNQFLQNSIIYY